MILDKRNKNMVIVVGGVSVAFLLILGVTYLVTRSKTNTPAVSGRVVQNPKGLSAPAPKIEQSNSEASEEEGSSEEPSEKERTKGLKPKEVDKAASQEEGEEVQDEVKVVEIQAAEDVQVADKEKVEVVAEPEEEEKEEAEEKGPEGGIAELSGNAVRSWSEILDKKLSPMGETPRSLLNSMCNDFRRWYHECMPTDWGAPKRVVRRAGTYFAGLNLRQHITVIFLFAATIIMLMQYAGFGGALTGIELWQEQCVSVLFICYALCLNVKKDSVPMAIFFTVSIWTLFLMTQPDWVEVRYTNLLEQIKRHQEQLDRGR